MIMALKEHKYAQACVLVDDYGNGRKDYTLVSYNTVVAGILPDGTIWCNGTYSRTTIKHIGWFAREHGLSYHDFKAVIPY